MDESSLTKPTAGVGQSGVPRNPRRKTVFGGTLETLSDRYRVAVRNISCTGAMVEGDGLPVAGQDAILRAQGLEFFCSIVWSEGARCGLNFDEPLAPAQVLKLHQITPQEIRSAELKATAEGLIRYGMYGGG